MRIAFISQPFDHVLPPHQTSIGLGTSQVARRLAREHEVIIYLKRHGDAVVPASERPTYVFAQTLPALPLRIINRASRLIQPPQRPPFAMIHNFLEYIVQICFDLRRRRPDVVHIQNFSQFVPVVRRLYPRATIVLHMQCEWLSQLDRSMIASRLAATDLMIGTSEYITDKVRKRFPEYARRCVTIYNGVEVERFAAQRGQGARGDGPRQVLFVGRVSPEKGVHTLIDAFTSVAERFADVQLNIVGPGGAAPREYIVGLSDNPRVAELDVFYKQQGTGPVDYMAQMQARVPAHLRERVIFHGGVAHAEIANQYRRADIFVNASYSDAFPIPVPEAMASGLPIVASAVGGIPEAVVDGETGRLVESGDIPALSEALSQLLADEACREAMGRAASERARRLFSWDLVTDNVLAEYRRCLIARAA